MRSMPACTKDDSCGTGRAAGDQIADRDTAIADAAVDRCTQLGEFEVERGLAYRLLLRGDTRLRDASCLRALVEHLLRDHGADCDAQCALQVRFGEGEVGFGLIEVTA